VRQKGFQEGKQGEQKRAEHSNLLKRSRKKPSYVNNALGSIHSLPKSVKCS